MRNVQTARRIRNSTRRVIGMHFVCRDDNGVVDDGNGIFRTGSWKVDPRHAETAEYVALHSSRSDPSYRQGHVLGHYQDPFQPDRYVFVAWADDEAQEWHGGGTGEKGYLWSE